MATISARDAALLGLGAGMGYLLACKVLGKAPCKRGPYKLVYHSKLGFRAAPIQMLLLDAGVDFEMVEPHWGADRVIENNPGMPSFAPPSLRVGDVTVAQTPAILKYLGRVLGYDADGGIFA